ncbi:MAG TPA: 2-oxoacid:acceptor oxidoreductase family protein [Ktedonobacteraceae bacterium]|nr:2-oxoacid:acceptor oxidoreductase family protein [Ktedonobacteraceae bacterium]
MKTTGIIMLGIGGQGTLTMMEMLAMAAEAAGEEVRVLSRVSLARLGGSGMCHVRLGPSASPAIPAGEADILIALEMNEILRALPMAREGALAFTSLYRRMPVVAGVTGLHYPTRAEVASALQEARVTGIFVPEVLPEPNSKLDPWQQQEDSRINILMLGVFAGYTHLLPRALLEQAIEQRLPRFALQNARTFAAGWNYGASLEAQKKLDNL